VAGNAVQRLALAGAWLYAGAVAAQPNDAGGIALDPLVIYPGMDVAAGYDDNLFLSDARKKGSALAILSPWLRVEGKPAPHRFDAALRYDAGRYADSSPDDYDDFSLFSTGHAVFSARTDVKARVEYVHGHDARGSTDRPAAPTPDEFVNTGGEATFGYGAPGARGRIEANGGFYSRQYQNNRLFTEASDRDTGILGGTFLWRVAPRTQLLLQGDWRSIDYDLETSTQDSSETRVYVGARWDATAATSGSAKVGRLKKDFDLDARQDVSTGSWEVGVRWSPLTYSMFDFNTSRQTQESTGVGDVIVSSIYNAMWTHSWSSRVQSRVLVGWTSDDFRGQGVSREDDTGTLGFRLNYQFRRWLRFAAEYTYTDRDSTEPATVYKRNYVLFTVGAAL
jgi:polysaccharide biosynthesis protein VpsM